MDLVALIQINQETNEQVAASLAALSLDYAMGVRMKQRGRLLRRKPGVARSMLLLTAPQALPWSEGQEGLQ